MSLRIGMVAGEPSGDRLGAGLLQALAARGPIEAIGIGGAQLARVGLESIAPMTESVSYTHLTLPTNREE